MRVVQAIPAKTPIPLPLRRSVMDRMAPGSAHFRHVLCAEVQVRAVPIVHSKQLLEEPRDRKTFESPNAEKFLELLPDHRGLIHPQTALQLAGFRGPRILFRRAAR